MLSRNLMFVRRKLTNKIMQKIITIAKKEFSDSVKNKLFIVLLVFLIGLVATSITVTSYDFQNKVIEYNKSVQILESLHKSADSITAPQFYPLKMLRGVMDYLEIIGAVIGIILGYLSIAKEKGKNTLQLILSRPVRRIDIGIGKIMGNSLLISLALAITAFVSYLLMWSIGGVQFSLAELEKLGLVFVFSFLYIMFFFSLTSVLAIKFKSLPNALIVSFVIWLAIVLILPQIGDTMDPDNQIPGGFFKTMNISKPQEKQIMLNFSGYEKTRNATEEASITKHYERLSFALLGIKDEYNGKTIGAIFKDKWLDAVWVLVFFLVSVAVELFVISKNDLIINKK